MSRLPRHEPCYVLDPADVHGPDFPGETFRVLKNNELKRRVLSSPWRFLLDAWYQEPRQKSRMPRATL